MIELLREKDVPAIFGSSYSPSSVLDQISREADVPIFWINDDNLPGEPGDPEHSYIIMRVQNMTTIAEALGGDPTPLDAVTIGNVPDAE